jgi:tRNA-splicing ligase RtcB
VLIGGSMGTASYILAGTTEGMGRAFGSAVHGAGRSLSTLAGHGILIRSPSLRGVAEEAPGAYKDVGAVVDAAEQAGLARKVARVRPLVCVKG